MKNLYAAIVLSLVVLFSSCSSVPITGRKQLLVVSDAQVNQSAAQSYSQLLSDPKTKVINNSTDAQRVKRIGNHLAAAIERYLKTNGYASQYNFKWEFNLIESKEVNAWCMPGGKVAVYSGILPVTKDDAGLATVMGHEIGHAIAKHSAEAISRQMLVQGAGGAVGVFSGGASSVTQSAVNQLYGVGGQLFILHYSRNQETEADRLGLTFMAMAGYDPHNALTFWQRMAALGGGQQQPEFLSTHPADATRIVNIQNRIPEAMKYYVKQ
ncbi:MAG: M48 family metallopeptidase [Janthinobacterium lividum]